MVLDRALTRTLLSTTHLPTRMKKLLKELAFSDP